MTLQNKVYEKQAIGVVGELADTSPVRATSYVLKANGTVMPKIGCAFTYATTENEVTIGGTGTFAGIAISPKGYALNANLSPSLELASGAVGAICSMGHVNVVSKTAVSPNNIAAFDPATGEIYAYATTDAATTAEHTVIPNAKFVLCSAKANEIAILELNP